jgi:lipopolysaccharide transport system ATP-binding protein
MSGTQISTNPTSAPGDLLLSVEHLSKKFCRSFKRSLLYGVRDIVTEVVGATKASRVLRKGEFWALKDVTFQLRRGQALGLVGANGAGKTTLLRIVSGLIKPDDGVVKINARVVPLIALGAGFNPVMTGRENIFVNMSILGLGSREINSRLPEVLDFADIGEAIDSPVRTYSSGMAARLGFACAVYANPEILLIDEVLAVGDLKFRIKCYRRLAKLRENGTCFVLVSHNLHSVLSVCDSALYLSEGKLVMAGEPRLILSKYEEDLLFLQPQQQIASSSNRSGDGNYETDLVIQTVNLKDEQGNVLEAAVTGRPVRFCITCHSSTELKAVDLIVAISSLSSDGERVLYLSSQYDGQTMQLNAGSAEIQVRLPFCGLMSGWYSAKLVISQSSIGIIDVVESFRFRVRSDEQTNQNLFYQPRSWEVISLGLS